MVPSVKKKTLRGAQVAVLFCMGLWDKDIGAVKVGSCLISCKCRILRNCFWLLIITILLFILTGRDGDRKGTSTV
jgi:hypothetical protein